MSDRLDLCRSPRNGEEGCRRRSNRDPDYMAPGANLKTRHFGILLSMESDRFFNGIPDEGGAI